MVFTINTDLIFIDSMQFMNSSLDSLVNNLSDNDFKYFSEEFSGNSLKLIKEKGVYPYHDLYLKRNVLLLTDVFKKFVSTCLDYYGLDPCHYFSSPGLSWDAMFKMTAIELELISDIDMHLFIEKRMRGCISYIIKRHSKANNKYMECYDSSNESIYITYLDTNNLYGWALTQYLPYSGFKWLNQKEISGFCLNCVSENSSIGYILEVDLEYHSKLLSKYCFNMANKYGIKICGVNKLVPNVGNKGKYVVHYRNLQLYLTLGIKLTKVNRILKFK